MGMDTFLSWGCGQGMHGVHSLEPASVCTIHILHAYMSSIWSISTPASEVCMREGERKKKGIERERGESRGRRGVSPPRRQQAKTNVINMVRATGGNTKVKKRKQNTTESKGQRLITDTRLFFLSRSVRDRPGRRPKKGRGGRVHQRSPCLSLSLSLLFIYLSTSLQ